MGGEGEEMERGGRGGGEGLAGGEEELKMAVTELKKKLHQKEGMHKIELQQSKVWRQQLTAAVAKLMIMCMY